MSDKYQVPEDIGPNTMDIADSIIRAALFSGESSPIRSDEPCSAGGTLRVSDEVLHSAATMFDIQPQAHSTPKPKMENQNKLKRSPRRKLMSPTKKRRRVSKMKNIAAPPNITHTVSRESEMNFGKALCDVTNCNSVVKVEKASPKSSRSKWGSIMKDETLHNLAVWSRVDHMDKPPSSVPVIPGCLDTKTSLHSGNEFLSLCMGTRDTELKLEAEDVTNTIFTSGSDEHMQALFEQFRLGQMTEISSKNYNNPCEEVEKVPNSGLRDVPEDLRIANITPNIADPRRKVKVKPRSLELCGWRNLSCNTCDSQYMYETASNYSRCPLCHPQMVCSPRDLSHILSCVREADQPNGIIANLHLRRGSVIGPLEGEKWKLSLLKETEIDMAHLWVLYEFDQDGEMLFLSTVNENTSNILRDLRPGQDWEANLAMVLKKGQVYFVTLSDVRPGEELVLKPTDPLCLNGTDWLVNQSCPKCDLSFQSTLYMQRHWVFSHYQGPMTRNFPCKVCSRTFSNKQHMADHTFKEHGHGAYLCDACNTYFRTESSLRVHKDSVHANPFKVKMRTCVVCQMVLANKSTLRSHLELHQVKARGKKPYRCQLCRKGFWEKHTLKRHTALHEGRLPHCCDRCGKVFSNSSNLKIHMLTHSGVKPFLCEVEECGSKFTTKQSLQFHYRRIHKYSDDKIPEIRRSIPFTLAAHTNTLEAGELQDNNESFEVLSKELQDPNESSEILSKELQDNNESSEVLSNETTPC